MKREGRQHGMVRAYENLPIPGSRRKMINEFSSPPTAGLFTRVPTKPTNHSKYTGKCGRPRCRGCHSHPVCKSMDKVKGAHKIRSSLDGAQGLKFYGYSASGVLNYLDRVDRDYDDDQETDVFQASSCYPSLVLEVEEVDVLQVSCDSSPVLEIEELGVFDDGTGFCEVGLVWEEVEGDDSSWCLIDEIGSICN